MGFWCARKGRRMRALLDPWRNALACLAVGVALAGCTNPTTSPTSAAPSVTGSPPASPSSTGSMSPSPSPSLDAEAQALEDAKQRVVDMWAMVDEISRNPKKSINDLDPYTSGEWRTRMQLSLSQRRASGYTTTGSSEVEITNARKVGKTWVVEACVDVSGLKTVDKNGKSVTGPPYRILHKSTVKQGTKTLVIAKDEAVTEC